MFIVRLFLFVTLAIALGTANARAFVREIEGGFAVEWNKNRTVLMHLSLPTDCAGGHCGPLQDGFASYNASAADALNLWNQQLVHMHFAVNSNSIVPPDGVDANTSVSMSRTIYGEAFGGDTLAVTLVSPRDQHLIEADVIFNDNFAWDSYHGVLQSGVWDLHR